MNIKSLRAFVLVVEEGSLVAASGKMALSQPAVSRLINLLEADAVSYTHLTLPTTPYV